MTDPQPAATSEPVDEFEREPVPPRARLGFRSFVGQYAGEHTAGTELMIGRCSSPPASARSTWSSACSSATCWRC